MKHTFKVTIILVLFFFMAQFTGLLVVNHYIDHAKTIETKKVEWRQLPYNLERPEVRNESISFVYITIAILMGTFLVLLLIKFNKPLIWKLWFFMTVWITLAIAFAAFINNVAAAVLALIAAVLKLYRPGIIMQNLSEIFIYGGLAAIFVPMMNLFAAFMLLIVISVYDYISVFRTKHMIKLAKFQSKSKVFAGLLVPYEVGKMAPDHRSMQTQKLKETSRAAVLGGGDIGFTLIFAGVVMKELMLQETVLAGFLKAMIIPAFAAMALLFLLIKGRQNKFYPAMPILSLGCFLGYAAVWLI